jgi:hypothetical protein
MRPYGSLQFSATFIISPLECGGDDGLEPTTTGRNDLCPELCFLAHRCVQNSVGNGRPDLLSQFLGLTASREHRRSGQCVEKKRK